MRVGEIVERFGGLCEGDAAHEITGVAGVDAAGPSDLTFALDEKSLAQAEEHEAGCVIVPPALRASALTLVRYEAPQRYLAEVMEHFCPPPNPAPGIHPSAVIGKGTVIDPRAYIGPQVVIGDGCRVAERVVLLPAVVIGDGCIIGAGTVIHPHVTLYADTRIGARVIIHGGAVIGADGFGYFPDRGLPRKWPHIGNVVIEDEVEIGANACIDRAKFGTTLIERGAKIDNLVQIAHNCHVGMGAMLAGQTGLSGSVTVEAGAVCAGQVGIADHHTIGRGARLGAQTGVVTDIPPGAEVVGYPAKPAQRAFQEIALLGYLVENRTALRRLLKSVPKK